MTEIIIRTNVLKGENQGVTFINGCTWNDLHTGSQGFTIAGKDGFGVSYQVAPGQDEEAFYLDHEERTLALAALTLRRLKDIEGNTEVKHVTWVQEDAGRSHELLETVVRWKDSSWSGGSIPSGRLRLVLQEFLAKYTVRTVKEMEDESGKVGLVLSSEDIKRVRFLNGRSYNDDSVFGYGSGNRGFTITKKSGEEVEYHVPAYTERAVYRLDYEQRQLAMMALLLEKLDDLDPDRVITSAEAPIPTTEHASALENVLYAPLGTAPDGGYHICVKDLKRVFKSFLDTLTVTDGDYEGTEETMVIDLNDDLLRWIKLQECDIDPWTDYEVRGSSTLGFTVTLKGGVIKRFTPRSSDARGSVFSDRFEDRRYALAALALEEAKSRGIKSRVTIREGGPEVYRIIARLANTYILDGGQEAAWDTIREYFTIEEVRAA
jgi:hypothetical protein